MRLPGCNLPARASSSKTRRARQHKPNDKQHPEFARADTGTCILRRHGPTGRLATKQNKPTRQISPFSSASTCPDRRDRPTSLPDPAIRTRSGHGTMLSCVNAGRTWRGWRESWPWPADRGCCSNLSCCYSCPCCTGCLYHAHAPANKLVNL